MARIRFHAKRLAARLRVDDQRRDDFRHDLVLEVLESAERFNPSKSTWHTFACRVIRLRAVHLRRDEMTRRRFEMDDPMEDTDDNVDAPEVVEKLTCDGNAQFEAIDLFHDTETILSRMPERLRAVCELLKEHSVSETARLLGVHRNSVYRQIAEIREHYKAGGYGR